jgi:glutaredoxin
MEKEIVVYSRSFGCPYVSTAKQVLNRHHLSYRVILINQVPEAKKRVLGWTGFESVPTIVAAYEGQDLPYEPPDPLPAGASPKGINRGSMITEPSAPQLEEWLRQHAFIR